jgi:hypothetical protein
VVLGKVRIVELRESVRCVSGDEPSGTVDLHQPLELAGPRLPPQALLSALEPEASAELRPFVSPQVCLLYAPTSEVGKSTGASTDTASHI